MRAFTIKLEQRGIRNITVNTCEPGSAITELQRVSGKETMMKIIMFLWKPMTWSVEKAAATSIWLATSQDVEGKTGGFYGNCKEKKVKQKLVSAESQQMIWDYCEQTCSDYI